MIDNTEGNHSTNLIAQIHLDRPQSKFEKNSQSFRNLFDMRKSSKPNTPSGVRFVDETQLSTCQTQKPKTTTTDGTRTPESSSKATPAFI